MDTEPFAEIDCPQQSLSALLSGLTPSFICASGLLRLHIVDGVADVQRHAIVLQRRDASVGMARCGRTQSGFSMDLHDAADALQLTALLAKEHQVRLRWSKSRMEIDGDQAQNLLDRWLETKEPPTLSIVALDLEVPVGRQFSHRTTGLEPFVGHEIEVQFAALPRSRECAAMLARLARHALMHGPIGSDATIRSAGGKRAKVKRRPGAAVEGDMVTIIL